MFGQMMVDPVVQLDLGVDLQTVIATLIKVAKTSRSFVGSSCQGRSCCSCSCPETRILGGGLCPDRKKGTWYAVGFEDEQFGGYSVSQLEMLLKDCNFLDLIERPGLWRPGLRWMVMPGIRPEAAV